MDRIVLDEEKLPLQQLFIIAQAAAPSSGDKLQREKGRPGNGDILCDVSKEKAGDGACQLGNTNDSPYPDLCQKKSAHYVLNFWVSPKCSQGQSNNSCLFHLSSI